MITRTLGIKTHVYRNVSESYFLEGKTKLGTALLAMLKNLKLEAIIKSSGSAPDRGLGAIIEMHLNITSWALDPMNQLVKPTGNFKVGRQASYDKLVKGQLVKQVKGAQPIAFTLNLSIQNLPFNSEDDFITFKTIWDINCKRGLEKLFCDTYKNMVEITHI